MLNYILLNKLQEEKHKLVSYYDYILQSNPKDYDTELKQLILNAIDTLVIEDKTWDKIKQKYLMYQILEDEQSLNALMIAFRGFAYKIKTNMNVSDINIKAVFALLSAYLIKSQSNIPAEITNVIGMELADVFKEALLFINSYFTNAQSVEVAQSLLKLFLK